MREQTQEIKQTKIYGIAALHQFLDSDGNAQTEWGIDAIRFDSHEDALAEMRRLIAEKKDVENVIEICLLVSINDSFPTAYYTVRLIEDWKPKSI